MRLIDADKLKKVIPDVEPDCFECCGDCNMLNKYDIEELIDDQPTVEAEPVKHGKWKVKFGVNVYGGVICTCSECGYTHIVSRIAMEYENYCCNCGAKMATEVENETD